MAASRVRAGSADAASVGSRPLITQKDDFVLNGDEGGVKCFKGPSEDGDFSHLHLRLPEEAALTQGLLIDPQDMTKGALGIIGTPLVRTVAAANVLT